MTSLSLGYDLDPRVTVFVLQVDPDRETVGFAIGSHGKHDISYELPRYHNVCSAPYVKDPSCIVIRSGAVLKVVLGPIRSIMGYQIYPLSLKELASVMASNNAEECLNFDTFYTIKECFWGRDAFSGVVFPKLEVVDNSTVKYMIAGLYKLRQENPNDPFFYIPNPDHLKTLNFWESPNPLHGYHTIRCPVPANLDMFFDVPDGKLPVVITGMTAAQEFAALNGHGSYRTLADKLKRKADAWARGLF
jgi:hypothetical protein